MGAARAGDGKNFLKDAVTNFSFKPFLNKNSTKKTIGFTLIELLVVMAIIGIIAIATTVLVTSSRQKARDATRLHSVGEIIKALYLYYDQNSAFPSNTDNDCSGWDTGYNGGPGSGDAFISPLQTAGYFSRTPGDPTTTGNCSGIRYYRYSAGSYGCTASRGAYFVLGISDLERTSGTYPTSPGWRCPENCTPGVNCTRNWQSEFEWVVGEFEK